MSLKAKILIPVILLSLGVVAKFILWDAPISNGKRTGNLVKVSEKGRLIKTWEGTLDLGSGDKLTFDFSIKDDELARELYEYSGEEVSIYYEEHFLGWPRDTKYNVIRWQGKTQPVAEQPSSSPSSNGGEGDRTLSFLGSTLFCSVLGSLYQDQDLYQKVKEHLRSNNLYLYRQIEKCND